ncbi:hypothetical protein [Ramlibacter sp. 2FC]|uniref:hypothetical protein n=1 Tax=Ramlibacter sp. 2FC TaxID=2502188 RepID=UPI0010F9E38C|nr:hypothetical protein [Ramlibacter sp. 2FC]
MLARKPMLQALDERHALAACEVIDVAALRDETLIVGMATLLAVTGLGVTLVPASMGNVQFPGIAYRLLTTRALMDLRCYCLRDERWPAAHQRPARGADAPSDRRKI